MKRFALLVFAGIGFVSVTRGDDTTNASPSQAAPENPLGVVLEDACSKGDINQIPVLVDQGAPLDIKIGKQGLTLLILASTHDMNMTRFLIGKGAPLDAVDNDGNTALNSACLIGKTDCALALLDAGANPNLCNQAGKTPLIAASGNDDSVLVKALIAHHADINTNTPFGSALTWAIYCNRLDIMKLLVDSGAGVNLVPPARKMGSTYAPLHVAASTGNLAAMDFLFDHHADIELLDSRNFTPLLAATEGGQSEAVQELLDRKAAVDSQCKTLLWTPLMMAAHKGYFSIAEALISNGANLELRDYRGRTALILAAKNLQSQTVKLLVFNGANVNATDSQGETALTYAGSRGDTALASWLKENGATKTQLHVLAWPEPQPPLSPARSWALAVSAVYTQIEGSNPNSLGYDDVPSTEISGSLQSSWKITDRLSLLHVLDDLKSGTLRLDWQNKGSKLADMSDADFKTYLLVSTASFATSRENFEAATIRSNYRKWRDRTGVGFSYCVYANLVNRGYTLHYLDEKEAWSLLLANARLMQYSFSSWQAMAANFLDGREIWADERDARFDICTHLLLNPKDPNSPWNKLPWKTDLSAN